MFDRWREARAQPHELNLIPIMNLMITLIPFLMLGAAFYHLGVIPTSLPDHVETSAPPPSDEKVTLNLVVAPDQMTVTASSATLPPETTDALRREVRNGPSGAYDLAALTAHLAEIKARYPKSDTLVVLPDAGLRYATLVEVLDATREQRLPDDPGGRPRYAPLFPVTVFSERILEAPDAGVDDAPAEATP